MVLGATTIEWQWCCCVSVGTAQCYTCLKRSPQHVQSVRKALMPSIHFSKDIHTGHQAQHFTQGSGNGPRGARGRWGEPEIRDLLLPVSSRSDLGVITVHWHCSVCRSTLNALGFDSHSRSLENGGSSVWVEQLPAPSSARGDAFPSTSSSRALCRHKNLEKFPVKAVQSRHLSSRPAFTAQLSVFSVSRARSSLDGASLHVAAVRQRKPRNSSFQVRIFWNKDRGKGREILHCDLAHHILSAEIRWQAMQYGKAIQSP